MPNVKKVYDKFHDKGFEILSVSLDDKKDNWVNAIEKNDLNWGHVSSLKGWGCPVAKLYNVSRGAGHVTDRQRGENCCY